jgi:DNA-nicking Smr family endonuclease
MVKDLDLFRAAMADVTPLKGRRARPSVRSTSTRLPGERSGTTVASTVRKTAVAAEDFSFDRDIDRALSRGRRAPEAKLDLHGMTLAAAEQAVARFLEEAAALDLRVVLVVTGKGLRSDGDRIVGGRIRAEFPSWLERPANRVRVRGLKSAHPRHGGSGAFYVLLRRPSRGQISAG